MLSPLPGFLCHCFLNIAQPYDSMILFQFLWWMSTDVVSYVDYEPASETIERNMTTAMM